MCMQPGEAHLTSTKYETGLGTSLRRLCERAISFLVALSKSLGLMGIFALDGELCATSLRCDEGLEPLGDSGAGPSRF